MSTAMSGMFGTRRGITARALGAATALALLSGLLSVTSAQGAVLATPAPGRIDLNVLVLEPPLVSGQPEPTTAAIEAQLDREGVPYTKVPVGAWPSIHTTANYLSQTVNAGLPTAYLEGKYEGIVIPDRSAFSSAADLLSLADLDAYAAAFGVREVSSYAYPSTLYGLTPPGAGSTLDGQTATLQPAATAAATPTSPAGAFSYLSGTITIDNIDPAISEVYGYPVAAAASATWVPLVTVPSGTIMGVKIDAVTAREELVITADYNLNQQWIKYLGHGIVSWLTRGVSLSYNRNYLSVTADDLFLADDRWDYTYRCTSTADLLCGDNPATPLVIDGRYLTPVRMSSTDLTNLVAWQNTNNFKIDFAFNAGGTVGTNPAPLSLINAVKAASANSSFHFINHTYDHEFLGCLQTAPSESLTGWQCENSTFTGPVTPGDPNPDDYAWYPEAPSTINFPATGTDYLGITSEVSDNLTWASANLTAGTFDPTELITGEHAGLLTTPQQPMDNPNLGPALQALGVTVTASDASRETGQRTVAGSTVLTVPRHPMDIYYNAANYQDLVSEYNWIYLQKSDASGKGNCTGSATTTCMTVALDDTTNAAAKTSFDNYIKPLVARISMGSVATNDPRPFYAHQSNLIGDRTNAAVTSGNQVLLPVLETMLSTYRSTFATNAPIVQTTLKQQSTILQRQGTWATARNSVAATAGTYLDADGVHVDPAVAPAGVALTVPAGTTAPGVATAPVFGSYDGSAPAYANSLSGWTTATTGRVTGPIANVGFKLAPGAPGVPAAAPTAVSGNAQVTLTWPNVNPGGSPITSYLVTPTATPQGGVAAVLPDVTLTTAQAPAGATTTTGTITGLTNGTTYTFTVRAVNGFAANGIGLPSLASNAVVPMTLPGTIAKPVATPSDQSVTLTWVDPVSNGGSAIDSYRVTVTKNAGVPTQLTVPLASTTASVSGRSALILALTNGASYTFAIEAHNSVGYGTPVSPASDPVIPATAPTQVTGVVASNPRLGAVDLAWTAPSNSGGPAIAKYVVTPYIGAVAQTPVTIQPPVTSTTITGLTNGTSYTFTVTAVNAAPSSSAPSAASNALTPYGAPGAPSAVTATRGDHSAYVSWGASADNGSVVTGYTVTPYAAGVAQTPLAPSGLGVNVTGLTNGVSYTFVVTATNAAGPGPSATSAAVTPSGVPTVVVSKLATTITPVTTAAKIIYSWTATPNGAPITSYQVFVRRAGLGKPVPAAWTLLATTSATKLAIATKPGETLFVSVQATDAAGTVSGYAPSSQPVTVLVPTAKLSLTKKAWTKFGKLDYQSAKLGAAAVTPSVAKIRRIYVQAATGVGFGMATVWIGKTKLTTLNLGVAKKAQVNPSKVFTVALTAKQTKALTGALIVTVAKAGKLVRLRGVGALR